ncbi:biotin--[acetyl-CoA-carboxylase] ligase [Neomegalonema sp.]|uniref:biotin--[acetyl-CoA-carboxylase] ligase n=1 Tax=Neomegalonema sp. TaxID=2039713 RepID=UPI002630DF21|nr:biotin--[acetyl-CoA-carboxylase] ligase [Neomegalonema sp.]MDD2869892.1 biotin--[acetyl-CoA-carboxylase] ligase [Neomegalonema sp.]
MSLGLGLDSARVLRFDSLDSTNAEAARRAASGERGPLWILAKRQTAGRGRSGRAWSTPEGNLAATLLFAPEAPPAQAALHAFAAGLALAEGTLQALPGLKREEVRLKWPNDLLVKGGKASGLLLEASGGGLGRSVDWLAVGMGVNLATAPEAADARWVPIRLGGFASAPLDPEAYLTLVAARFDHWALRLATEGFAPLRQAWLSLAAGLGGPIIARTGAESFEGIFEDLDAQGALMLRQGSGLLRIAAADVHLPEPDRRGAP